MSTSTKIKFALLLIIIIISISLFGYYYKANENKKDSESFDLNNSFLQANLNTDTSENDNNPDNTAKLDNSKTYEVSDVVANVLPAIAAITCKKTEINQDFFYGAYQTESTSYGSGILISQNNREIILVTNCHVVDEVDEILVTFFDGSVVKGHMKGSDSTVDLAAVAVYKGDIPEKTLKKIAVASLGSSQDTKVGEYVFAVGNAMGYGNSVTTGILSAKDREVTMSDGIVMKLLQTDAAINPGNSGGALVNAHGQIIGINSVKYVSYSTERVGYAIPIDVAVPIINELMNYEEINESDRGYFGIVGREVNEDFAVHYGAPYGVYVIEIDESSAAFEAGLRKGDIITEFAGRKVTTMDEIVKILKFKRIGDSCRVKYVTRINGEFIEKNTVVILSKRNG